MKTVLPYLAGMLMALVGGGGVGGLLAVFWRRTLIKPEARVLDAQARAEDIGSDVKLSQEARAWLDDARADVAASRAAAQEARRDADASRAESVAAWRDREAERRRVETLEARVQELERLRDTDQERMKQLESVIREARLALPPWPARRGYPRDIGSN